MTAALLHSDASGNNTLAITLSGDWLLGTNLPGVGPVLEQLRQQPGPATLSFDTGDLGEWDTGLITTLIAIHRNAMDEIYEQMLYGDARHIPMATLVHDTLCATFNGLSKIYRACGYRVGWVAFSGDRESAAEYLHAVELLASLRLCANVPGQWAVQTALGGYQSIRELTVPGGRLFQARQAIIDGVAHSRFMSLCEPNGAMYAFPGVDTSLFEEFDDQKFAMELLAKTHVLIAPGSSFNVPYRHHFRLTTLATARKMEAVFERMEEVLESIADR